MRYSNKIQIALLRYGAVFFLFIMLSIIQDAQAQRRKDYFSNYIYRGIDVSFGGRTVKFKSDIPELSGLNLIEEGGNAGFIVGNSFAMLVIKPLGFYGASPQIGRTINLYTAEVENHTYLLRGLLQKHSQFDLYSILGLSFNSFKFFGHYISEDMRPANRHRPGEPYLGKIESLMMSIGAGLEYRPIRSNDFLYIFLSGKYLLPTQMHTDSEAFANTTFNNGWDLSLGVRFGAISSNKKIHSRL